MKSRSILLSLVGGLAISVPSMMGCAGTESGTLPPSGSGASGGAAPSGPPATPDGLPMVQSSVPPTIPTGAADAAEPPPISGGTLLVMQDGVTAVAADPDRDVVWVVDLTHQALLHAVVLQSHDEPGRVAEDASGHVHVILRRGGALVSIDPMAGTVLARRPVCPAPRGIAYDASGDALRVACADGRLFTFPAAGGDATAVVQLDSDLRDVVVQGSDLYVTRFRSAEILQVAADGTIAQRIALPVFMSPGPPMPATFVPEVAWRTVAMPGGGLAVLHQRAQEEAVSTMPGGYGMGNMGPFCQAIVHDAVTFVQQGASPTMATPLGMLALAVDVAVSPDGTQIAVAAPGSVVTGPFTVGIYPPDALENQPFCMPPPGGGPGNQQVTAVAFDNDNRLVMQVREPAALIASGITILLPGASVFDAGHNTFHTATQAGIACASCHPEAGDDGRVWQFDGLGSRRTQNLRGGVLARAPFHWSGDIPSMDDLVKEVLVGRMSGNPLDGYGVDRLGAWMDAQPALAPPPPADPAAVTRGEQLFQDPSVGCTGCHSGPELSDHQLVDVGTGGKFKVPSLIAVGYRAPYLHDGCAATLQDRFGPACSTGDLHGSVQQLSSAQIDDLIAYLQSL